MAQNDEPLANCSAVAKRRSAGSGRRAFPEHGAAKETGKIRDWPDAILACRIKVRPSSHVLFRPEEIHLASSAR